MNFAAYLRSLCAKFFRRKQTMDELAEELHSHIQLRTDDLERSGLSRTEAERRARVEFGGYEHYREATHESLGGHLLETSLQDVRFSLRSLRKVPGFAIAAILTLALAIGANAVVFGVMDGLILRPLDVPQYDTLWGTIYGEGSGWQAYPNYKDLRDRNRSFEDLAAFNFAFVGLDTGKNPALSTGFTVSGNYFDVLKIRPYLGHFFHASDEHGPNSAPYIVLSHAYWHSHFQDDRSVVGRVIRINSHPFTITGVAPPGFRGTLSFVSPDFFVPIVNDEITDGESGLNNRSTDAGLFEAFGHLKPGVTPAQAIADVNSVAAYLEKAYPKEFGHKTSSLARPGLTSFAGPAAGFVAGLMLLAGLILLAACANLGTLFAARAADRSREVALRLALGSGRTRIVRHLFTEALLISLAGGALGLVISIALLRRLSEWQPFAGAPIRLPLNPDVKVYIVALVLALLSGLLFSILPVRQVLRTSPYEVVKAGPGAGPSRRLAVRDALLVIQIAICAVLVTSSMVAVRGLMRSLHGNFGLEPHDATTASTNLVMAGYSGEKVPVMQKRMIHALESIPGVQSVGLINGYPPLVYTAGSKVRIFKEQTSNLIPANAASMPYRYEVSADYFKAAGTALLAGRSISWSDDKGAPAVAVVNREFAASMFGSIDNTVGKYFRLQDGTRVQVAGVVEDGKYQRLTENQEPAMFLSFLQSPSSHSYLIVRSARDPQQLMAAIRSKLRDLDAGLPADIEPWTKLMDVVLFPARIATAALGVLGLMGAVLSLTGIFGMAAYSVSKRLRELGIRVALGAQRKEVLQAALGRALKLLVFGSAAGLVLGLLGSRILAYIVYGATPRDPLVLAGVVLAMALLGLVATWIPAQRALSVDPLILLREE